MGVREPRDGPFAGVILMVVGPSGSILLRRAHGEVASLELPSGDALDGERPRETALRSFRAQTGIALHRLRYFGPLAEDDDLPPRYAYFADDRIDVGALPGGENAWQFVGPENLVRTGLAPAEMAVLNAFIAHDFYRGMVALQRSVRHGASVLALDRWGRVLLQLRDDDLPPERFPGQWSLAGGLIEPDEAPDAAAIREFEEETGQVLEELQFYRTFRKRDLPGPAIDAWHIYFCDPDIAEEAIDVREGQAFRYFAPAEVADLSVPPAARVILEAFFASPAYRALFH